MDVFRGLTLCKYDLRKGDLFVLSWARVRRVRRGQCRPDLNVQEVTVPSMMFM